ncbi:pilus assembly protein PilP [Luteimonas sp. FCS-9]|uniref:pilus assembly protein PilP n=1 Tax=Luteimonas sp. FCS-9 TaxID=1547516 RepID=UPI00063EB2F7|nr:pilus assembly protein PilP [Luteimonas sp. FCS-9]KLI99625.1 fimbrial protein [Luteimonas sp. FCS-9]
MAIILEGRPLLLGVIVLLVAGCGRDITSEPGDAPNLEVWIDEVRQRPAPPLEPLPVMQQFETFEYSAQGIRDPFSNAFTDTDSGSGLRPDSNRRKEITEQFPLDSMAMVGTMNTGARMLGLVLAPDKVTYRIAPGNYLGQNDGRVTSVTDNRIELVELVPDGAGGWLERPASLALNEN